MNEFGGNWTERKINILVEYARAYLTVMSKNKFWNLLYFDGFGGSGYIIKDNKADIDVTVGAALRIIDIEDPISFDEYYIVEKSRSNINQFKWILQTEFPNKKVHLVKEDCNKKLLDLAEFLKENHNKYRVLAYLDPYGMQLEWNSIKALQNIKGLDIWVLVPTGLGVNRLLTKSGDISDTWLSRLEKFLGMKKEEVIKYFYKDEIEETLFGNITHAKKIENAIDKSAQLYMERLKDVFNFVTKPFCLKNDGRTPMFHFYMVSNNNTAYKIASQIIKKYEKAG